MRTDEKLAAALRRNAVETGSLICLGCAYENECGIHGCTIMRESADALEQMQAQLAEKDRQLGAAVELIDKLERCTYLLDAGEEQVQENAVMRHTLDAAMAAIRAWRGQHEAEVPQRPPTPPRAAHFERRFSGEVEHE